MKKKGKKIQVTIGGFPRLVSKKEFLALVSFYNDMADFILGMEPTPTLLTASPKLLKKKKEVEKFVDEVGLPLYEELTKIDKEQWEEQESDKMLRETIVTPQGKGFWHEMYLLYLKYTKKKAKLLRK